jgi:hypothetical protein
MWRLHREQFVGLTAEVLVADDLVGRGYTVKMIARSDQASPRRSTIAGETYRLGVTLGLGLDPAEVCGHLHAGHGPRYDLRSTFAPL